MMTDIVVHLGSSTLLPYRFYECSIGLSTCFSGGEAPRRPDAAVPALNPSHTIAPSDDSVQASRMLSLFAPFQKWQERPRRAFNKFASCDN